MTEEKGKAFLGDLLVIFLHQQQLPPLVYNNIHNSILLLIFVWRA